MGFNQRENNELPKKTGEPVGSVIVERDVMIVTKTEYDIYELTRATRSGSTHVAVNNFGDPVILLSKDAEGQWVVDQQVTTGRIDLFFNK